MDRLRTKTVVAEKYGDGSRRVYSGQKKQPSEPLAEFDPEGPSQAAIERMPILKLTDQLLRTTPGTAESHAALQILLEVTR